MHETIVYVVREGFTKVGGVIISLLTSCLLAACSTYSAISASDNLTGVPPVKILAQFSLPCGHISGDTIFSQDLAYVDLDGCPDGWPSATHAFTDRGYIYDLRRHDGFETRLAKGYRDKALGSNYGDIDSGDIRFIGTDRRIYWLRYRGAGPKSDYRQDCGNGVIRIEGFEKIRSCLLIFSLTEDGQINAYPTAGFKEDVLKDAVFFAAGDNDLIFGYDASFFGPLLLKLKDGRWQPYRTDLPAAKLNITGDDLVSNPCGWAYAETFYCGYHSSTSPDSKYGFLRYNALTGETTLFPGVETGVPIAASNGMFVVTSQRTPGRNNSWIAYDRNGRKLYDSERDDERGSPPYIGFPGKRDWGGADSPKFTSDGERFYAIRSPKEFDIYQTRPFKRLTTLKPDVFDLPYFETFAVDSTTGNVLFCARHDCVIAKTQ